MMKRIRRFVFSLLMFLFIFVSVNAETVQVDSADSFLEAVKNGEDIKLTDDINLGEFTGAKAVISEGEEINLDLNGYIISGKSSDETLNAMLIKNNGTLIISDSSEKGTGKITLSDTEVALGAYSVGSYTIKNYGTLIVNSGTIENTGKTDVPYPIDNDTTLRNTTTIINGGKIVGNKAAIRAFCNSEKNENKVIVNDGVITAGNSAIWISQVNKKANKGYLEVNGGTITGIKNNGIYLSVFDQSLFTNIKVKITGGTIKNNSEKAATLMYEPWTDESDLANAVINLDITGGTFINENENGNAFVEPAYAHIPVTYTNIVGGSFSSDVSKYIASGVETKKIGDLYTVGKANKVIIKEVSNGKVLADKTSAIVGEIINLTIDSNEGYEVSTIKVVDEKGNNVDVNDNKFVMPNSGVTVDVEFNKIPIISDLPLEEEKTEDEKVETEDVKKEDIEEEFITSDIPILDVKEKIEKVSLGFKDKTVVDSILFDTIKFDKELSAKIGDSKVNVLFEITPIGNSNVSIEVAKVMKEKAGKAVITNYFDISIAVKDEKGIINETISELTKKIELMIALPEELRNNNKDVTRKYYVVREHIVNGKSEVDLLETELSEDGKYLTFKTDKFSTYALAYEDIEKINTPNTGDNIIFYISLCFVSLLVFGISIKTLNKKLKK